MKARHPTDREKLRWWYWNNTVELVAAKIVLDERLVNLEAVQLETVIGVFWIDVAHTILTTHLDYDCHSNCFLLLRDAASRLALFRDKPQWNLEQFNRAVIKKRDDMRRCTKLFLHRIYR